MTAGLVASLIVLALVDGTSFGTLALPLLMLVQPRLRHRQLATYLFTIVTFYFLLGLGLLYAGTVVREGLGGLEAAINSRSAYVIQLVLGIGLVVVSYALDPKYAHHFRRGGRPAKPSSHQRWKGRLLGPYASLPTTVAVALGAGLIESASMLPYLGAIGLITATRLPAWLAAGTLAAYVVVMCLPALWFWLIRTVARHRVEATLRRAAAWLDRHSASAVAWTVSIVGVLLAINAATTLWSR